MHEEPHESSGDELLLPTQLPADHRSGFVAVVGKPNVGKSTLINAYIGYKVAIVSPKPQTTRRRIEGILTLPQAQIVFIDTPGIHKPQHKLGEYMLEVAQRAVRGVDLILWMADVSQPPSEEDVQIAQLLTEKVPAPIILALNKMDLLPPDKVMPHSEAYFALLKADDWMMVSATRGDNRDKLLEMVIARLPPGPQYYPSEQFTDQDERTLVAELIWEAALHHLQKEVPYGVAVVIEEYSERRENLVHIAATVYVEKTTHKGIVLGRGGGMIKRIGQAARREIERLLGRQVYLELWVKVRPRWRKDEVALRSLGFALPEES
ncbi:MAG: GTPase Era [Chloroflexi bacterium]|nr:GTPase Era [Chloroflexota bacterium]